jgi:hypothetical protein
MNFSERVILANHQSLKRFDSFDIFAHLDGKKSSVECFGVIRFCVCSDDLQLSGILYLCPFLSFHLTILFGFAIFFVVDIFFGFAFLIF